MPELIKNNHVFLAVSPLYRITLKGDKYEYLYSDKELASARKKYGSKILNTSRFKGLGEVPAHLLWETTMNPATRKLIQVTLNDAVEAERITKIYMGTKVEDRKEKIMNLATDESIDIDY